MTMNASAIRGTCLSCGRWVTTYTRRGDSALLAYAHKSWGRAGSADAGEWKECTGSNQPVKA